MTARGRGKQLIGRLARRALTAVEEPLEVPEPPPAPEPPPLEPALLARRLGRGELAVHQTGASRALYERLTTDDVREVERSIDESPLREAYEAQPDPDTRRHMVLAFGLWLDPNGIVAQRTGLHGVHPPDDIHVMARGPTAAAGGLYEADIVFDALAGVGVELQTLKSCLDFGCSSGRVVRVLAALYPHIDWHGCDPNAQAIAWGSENLPGVDFFKSEDTPPLPLADRSLDLVYAISIWSHFAPELGLRWFEEMRRVLRPGGYLVCTTHGLTSVAHYAVGGMRTVEQSLEIRDALYSAGCWYAAEFGEEGDWGVVHPEWGTAFLSPEWMLAQLCPAWRVIEFAVARNQENQDVYVLQRA